MKKTFFAGLLSFTFLLTTSNTVNAEDIFDWINKQTNTNNKNQQKQEEQLPPKYSGIIQPFGGLNWDDGLKDIVEKIIKIKGLEEFYITVSNDLDKLSIKSIKISDLPKKVSEALLKKNDVYENPKDSRLTPTYYMENQPWNLGKYRDKNFKDVLYYPHDLYITASPVMISGVPFHLVVKMSNLPALALDRPQKVFKDKIGYSYPVVPTVVTLYTDSRLLQGKNAEISEALQKKYGIQVSKTTNGNASLSMTYAGAAFSGDKESFLSADDGGEYYKIKYESTYYPHIYYDTYQKHLKAFETHNNKGKQDLKNGL